MVAADQQGGPDYEVGYKRPPKGTQFKPGQRGNPRGRPRGSPNKRALVERALNKKISVRKGDKTTKVPIMEAIVEVFAVKAAQGDRHAAAVVISLASKSGVFGGRENQASNLVPESIGAARDMRPSDRLVEGVDLDLLSKEEQIALSKLAERIDIGGDVTALSGDDFLRLKQIVSKARGENVSQDGTLRKAA